MAGFGRQHISAYLPFDGCRYCRSQCIFREKIEPRTVDQEIAERFKTALLRFNTHPEKSHWPDNWRAIADTCRDVGASVGHAVDVDAAWCYFAHEIDVPFTRSMRRYFERAFDGLANQSSGPDHEFRERVD
jgi:hypothetical protein